MSILSEGEKLHAVLDKLFDTAYQDSKQILVTKDQLTPEQYEKYLFIFGEEAMNQAKHFAVDCAIVDNTTETPVTKIKPTPAVGHTCLIRHQVKRASNGDVLGLQRADGKGQRVPITAVYLDGQVRTGNSDVWEVQPAGMNTWETINPNHGKSE